MTCNYIKCWLPCLYIILLGRGTVVSGKIERGTLKQGDKCTILGFNQEMDTTVNSELNICNRLLSNFGLYVNVREEKSSFHHTGLHIVSLPSVR